MLVAESLYPKFRERDWSYWGEGPARRRVLEERRFDCAAGRVESTWTLIGNGDERSHTVHVRIYTYRELEGLLEAAGFNHFRALDDTGAPFKLGSARLWLVADASEIAAGSAGAPVRPFFLPPLPWAFLPP